MPLITPYSPVLRLKHNTDGIDYVVGDLHGCYDELQMILTHIGFHDNPANRLLGVGDLIDRGPKNVECANLIFEKWFYTTRGNHEQLMISAIAHGNDSHVAIWMGNGGQWYFNEPPDEMLQLAHALDTLPYIIVVEDPEQVHPRFNIVHGELVRVTSDFNIPTAPISDSEIDNWDFDSLDLNNILWGRNLVYSRGANPTTRKQTPELSITYCGHTPINAIQIERQIYLDAGAVFHHKGAANCYLNVACPTKEILYSLNMATKQIAEIPYSQLAKVRTE